MQYGPMKITHALILIGLLVIVEILILLYFGASLKKALFVSCRGGMFYGLYLSQMPIIPKEAAGNPQDEEEV